MNQSLVVSGVDGFAASTSAMDFADGHDSVFPAGDVSGTISQCIAVNLAASDENSRPAGATLRITFDDGTANDNSGFDNHGTLVGDATISDGSVQFDGVSDAVSIANTPDINQSIHQQTTVSLTFTADDVTDRQVLYEEGGNTRG